MDQPDVVEAVEDLNDNETELLLKIIGKGPKGYPKKQLKQVYASPFIIECIQHLLKNRLVMEIHPGTLVGTKFERFEFRDSNFPLFRENIRAALIIDLKNLFLTRYKEQLREAKSVKFITDLTNSSFNFSINVSEDDIKASLDDLVSTGQMLKLETSIGTCFYEMTTEVPELAAVPHLSVHTPPVFQGPSDTEEDIRLKIIGEGTKGYPLKQLKQLFGSTPFIIECIGNLLVKKLITEIHPATLVSTRFDTFEFRGTNLSRFRANIKTAFSEDLRDFILAECQFELRPGSSVSIIADMVNSSFNFSIRVSEDHVKESLALLIDQGVPDYEIIDGQSQPVFRCLSRDFNLIIYKLIMNVL